LQSNLYLKAKTGLKKVKDSKDKISEKNSNQINNSDTAQININKRKSRNKDQDRHKGIVSPLKKDPKTTVTDSDSKRFFEEVYDGHNDLDKILLDMPNINEEAEHHNELHEEDLHIEIKREIQTMRHAELKSILPRELRILNISDDEEGS